MLSMAVTDDATNEGTEEIVRFHDSGHQHPLRAACHHLPMTNATSPNGTRALRSDAAANRERLLVAAARAMQREGERVPMATIAEDAGVGVGTLYRHFPTRSALLAALSNRSYRLVLGHARGSTASGRSAIDAIGAFLDRIIEDRDQLTLPLHGGPVIQDAETAELRAEIRTTLKKILRRGQRDGTIRAGITPADIIITGALLAQPLPHAGDWDEIARRQARIYLAGLGT